MDDILHLYQLANLKGIFPQVENPFSMDSFLKQFLVFLLLDIKANTIHTLIK